MVAFIAAGFSLARWIASGSNSNANGWIALEIL
jgi:hypothetical protein